MIMFNTPIPKKLKHHRLIIVSNEQSQFLGSFDAPEQGWTQTTLINTASTFPSQWAFCGATALLNDECIGTTENLTQ